MMVSPIRVALFASGSGTDANAILDAQENGRIIDGEIVLLVVTKEDVPAIRVGQTHGVRVEVVPKDKLKNDFSNKIVNILKDNKIDLIFLVGCIHKIPVFDDIPAYNIHPADIARHGGKGMYGLRVHESVLEEIRAGLDNDRKNGIDRWFTRITVHEVNERYDNGPVFMTCAVEVFPDTDDPTVLQKRVLQYEWMLLPTAVNMAIRRLRVKRNEAT